MYQLGSASMNVDVADATLRRAAPGDVAMIEGLLSTADLPPDGGREALGAFVGMAAGARVVAAAGLESYGAALILRSVVVVPEARGRGLGRRLVAERLAHAAATGATDAYLLATTAEAFFGRIGFAAIH